MLSLQPQALDNLIIVCLRQNESLTKTTASPLFLLPHQTCSPHHCRNLPSWNVARLSLVSAGICSYNMPPDPQPSCVLFCTPFSRNHEGCEDRHSALFRAGSPGKTEKNEENKERRRSLRLCPIGHRQTPTCQISTHVPPKRKRGLGWFLTIGIKGLLHEEIMNKEFNRGFRHH